MSGFQRRPGTQPNQWIVTVIPTVIALSTHYVLVDIEDARLRLA